MPEGNRGLEDICAFVLDRPIRVFGVQLGRRMKRPVGIGKKRAPQHDQIGPLIGNDLFTEIGAMQQSYSGGRDPCIAFDSFGQRDLVSGVNRDILSRIIGA